MTFRLSIGGVLVMMAVTGCGGSGPELVPVEGTLTLDGKPLAHKTVFFAPLDDTPGHGAGGSSNAEGEYTLKAVVPGATRDYSGIPPGRYRVTVFEPMFPIDTLMEDEGDEPVVAVGPGAATRRPDLPRVYGSDRSPLVYEVPSSGGVIDVALHSNPSG